MKQCLFLFVQHQVKYTCDTWVILACTYNLVACTYLGPTLPFIHYYVKHKHIFMMLQENYVISKTLEKNYCAESSTLFPLT